MVSFLGPLLCVTIQLGGGGYPFILASQETLWIYFLLENSSASILSRYALEWACFVNTR
jgi:hypothetical protein